MTADLLERWLEAVLATPGATGLASAEDARRVLLDDAVRAVSVVDSISGPIVDVGSGGGSPGIPLAAALPARRFTLLEAERRKCAHLSRFAAELPNAEVVCGRAEEQPVETFGVALAKALAKPPVAAELCLPLVTTGGAAILWLGPTADRRALELAAEQVGGRFESESAGIAVVRKVAATPRGFPRRAGMAKKRPLG